MQDIKNSRSETMRKRMQLLNEKGWCLFCKEGMELFEKTMPYNGSQWFVTANDAPYKGAVKHVMAVPHRHVTNPENLTLDELNELFQVVIPWVRKNCNMEGISGLFRFGCTQRTGATIHHLHFHFIEGVDRVDQNHPPVFAVVGFQTDYQPEQTKP